MVIFTEIFIDESGLTVGGFLSTTGLGLSSVFATAVASSFMASVVRLISIEFYSKLEMRYTQLRDWIKRTKILYEKILNKSMID